MKNSLSSKLVFPRGGADGELGVAARNTLLGPGHGADGELGDSARITLPRIDLVADGERGDAARITSPGPDLGADGELGGAARTTSPGPDLGAAGYQLLPLKRNRKMCDSILYAPMDELEFERLLGLATLFNDNDEWPIDFTELQELSELLGKLKSCVDVAIDNAPEAAKS
ncbi:hypothetical protein [Pseudomonas aeruginosa]|uniref:hypothetical protein n=1 Tax=Pseudomonas aeruginosa TaxID=287 RepID=UPI0021AE5696|nr:hypothetical protein [Pseudomonas aeruginosa]